MKIRKKPNDVYTAKCITLLKNTDALFFLKID